MTTAARERVLSTRRTSPASTRSTRPTGRASFAVNLDPLESKTAPLHVETLEQFGCRLASHSPKPLDHAELRQMHNAELEDRQKLWRWLILAAIGVLIVETWLAGRRAAAAPFGSRGGNGHMSMALRQALEQVARRFRRVRLLSSLAICWLVWALVGCGYEDRLVSGDVRADRRPAGCWAARSWRSAPGRGCLCVVWALRRAAIRAGWPAGSRPNIPS